MTTPDIALASDGKSLITSVGTQENTVWVHDKDGDHQVTSEGNATSPKFSLDGRSLYFLVTSGQAHKQELWVRDLASGKMDKVLPDYSMQDYAISPDGKKVAFVMKDVTLNEDGELVDRGSFRTNPSSVDKWFTDLPRVWIAMEAGTHSIWISEQLQEFAHEVIVAKRARAAGNLAQWSKKRPGGCREAGPLCAARSKNPQADCAPHSRPAGSPHAKSRP